MDMKNFRGKILETYTDSIRAEKPLSQRQSCSMSSSLEIPQVTHVRCHSSFCHFQWSAPELTCNVKVQKSKARFMACLMKSLY